jgi:hypothetical protein
MATRKTKIVAEICLYGNMTKRTPPPIDPITVEIVQMDNGQVLIVNLKTRRVLDSTNTIYMARTRASGNGWVVVAGDYF